MLPAAVLSVKTARLSEALPKKPPIALTGAESNKMSVVVWHFIIVIWSYKNPAKPPALRSMTCPAISWMLPADEHRSNVQSDLCPANPPMFPPLANA